MGFHQIRHWSDAIELASRGDVAGASRMLLFVWAGHILLQPAVVAEKWGGGKIYY